MKKSQFKVLFSVLVMVLTMLSCENNLEMILPQGPQGEKGEKGDKGDPGKSAFELWKEVYGKGPETTVNEFLESLKGKDGFTPEIGGNGNWWIDGKDTGKPSVIIPEIGEGPEYHWIIDGVDTGKPSRGKDGANGLDGKSAYELWVSHLGDNCDGTITKNDNDKTPWDCSRTSWEDFLEWLQGGNVSVLHQYWTTLPGNNGKTIEQFITELFDCHCDGIQVGVRAVDDCVELNADGTLRGAVNAVLTVAGKEGASVRISGTGVTSETKTISNGQGSVIFEIPRGDQNLDVNIVCTSGGDNITKNAVIPSLKYVKLEGRATVTPVTGKEESVVVINFATVPAQVSVEDVEDVVIYQSGVITQAGTAAGWVVSNGGKTFTKTYARTSTVQRPTLHAKGPKVGDVEACSVIEEAFEIPQLTAVDLEVLPITAVAGSNCDLQLTVTGTPGMKVRASSGDNPANSVELTETSPGRYTTDVLPRLYYVYEVTVTAEMPGRGTVTRTVNSIMQEVENPLATNEIPGAPAENPAISKIEKRLINNTDALLIVKITRDGNTANGASQRHESDPFPFADITIPAKGYRDVEFYRDYTPTYGPGNYVITFTTINECQLEKTLTLTVDNLANYRSQFSREEDVVVPGFPGGWGSDPNGPGGSNWDPTDPNAPNPQVTLIVEVFDAIPNSFIQFQLKTTEGYNTVATGKADAKGYFTKSITMSAKELASALEAKTGYFKFFSDVSMTGASQYQIGESKERINFEL